MPLWRNRHHYHVNSHSWWISRGVKIIGATLKSTVYSKKYRPGSRFVVSFLWLIACRFGHTLPGYLTGNDPDSKVHMANTGTTWVLWAPNRPHVGPINLVIRGVNHTIPSWWLREYIALSYYDHQVGSMNYYPLFRVRSWNNGVRCVFLYSYTITPEPPKQPRSIWVNGMNPLRMDDTTTAKHSNKKPFQSMV